MKNTYWNHNGKYQNFADYLNTLIPTEGSVTNPRKNNAISTTTVSATAHPASKVRLVLLLATMLTRLVGTANNIAR